MLRLTDQSNRTSANDNDIDNIVQSVNAYLDKNDLAAAYPLLEKLCNNRPDNLQSHLIAGLVAVQVNRHTAARRHFDRALDINPDDYDTNYNSALLDLKDRRPQDARARFLRLLRMNPRQAGLHNDLGVIWSDEKRPARALACFSRALKLNPDYSQARNNAMQLCLENRLTIPASRILVRNEQNDSISSLSRIEIKRWKEIVEQSVTVETASKETAQPASGTEDTSDISLKTIRGRIAIFANHRQFIDPIIVDLRKRHDVRVYENESTEKMTDLLNWADIAWFEWCDDLLIQASKIAANCKIICRLHSYEAFTDMPARVNWSRVDRLIFVNRSLVELTESQIPPEVTRTVIHNGLDLNKFHIPDNKPMSKRIASVGYINYKKNPALLLYCFSKIHNYDNEYTLHIAGDHQDPRIAVYFKNYLNRHPLPVHFHGWVDDMPGWYADKGFVISTSLFESFHYSVAEGMVSGLQPLIHDWYGADYLYPSEYLYSDPDSCLELLQRLEKKNLAETRNINRQFIATRYNLQDKLKEIHKLLDELVQESRFASGSAGQ